MDSPCLKPPPPRHFYRAVLAHIIMKQDTVFFIIGFQILMLPNVSPPHAQTVKRLSLGVLKSGCFCLINLEYLVEKSSLS